MEVSISSFTFNFKSSIIFEIDNLSLSLSSPAPESLKIKLILYIDELIDEDRSSLLVLIDEDL